MKATDGAAMKATGMMKRVSGRIRAACRSFRSNESGAIAVYVSMFLFIVCLAAGGFYDYSKARMIQNEVELAVERALLQAGRNTVPADKRVEVAQEVLKASVSEETYNMLEKRVIQPGKYTDASGTEINYLGAQMKMNVPVPFGKLVDHEYWHVELNTFALISSNVVQNADFVFVLDASASMWPTLSSVKNASMSFRQDLNDRLTELGKEPMDGVRVRAVAFRDFFDKYERLQLEERNRASVVHMDLDKLFLTHSEGEYYTFDPSLFSPGFEVSSDLDGALVATKFYDFSNPDDASAFVRFFQNASTEHEIQVPTGEYVKDEFGNDTAEPVLQTVTTWDGLYDHGGGDIPEHGLQGVWEALHSNWKVPGDTTSSGAVIEKAYQIIVVWSDAPAYPIPYACDASGNKMHPQGGSRCTTPGLDGSESVGERWKNSHIFEFSNGGGSASRQYFYVNPGPKWYENLTTYTGGTDTINGENLYNLSAAYMYFEQYYHNRRTTAGETILYYITFIDNVARTQKPADSGRNCGYQNKCTNGWWQLFFGPYYRPTNWIDGGELKDMKDDEGKNVLTKIIAEKINLKSDPPRLFAGPPGPWPP
jgi:hypothetical protein